MASRPALNIPLPPTRFTLEVGVVVAMDEAGHPVVETAGSGRRVAASYLSGADNAALSSGAQVIVAVDEAQNLPPIVLTCVGRADDTAFAPGTTDAASAASAAGEHLAEHPGSQPQRLVLESEREVVLRCGKASITLTREGKVLLKGVDIVSRASAANKIKGASVNIN